MALVVSAEDDPDIRDLIVLTLSRDHEVVVVDNGRAGLDTAVELVPDVVLLDIEMPVLNGLDACRAIRDHERTAHVPVIIVSGAMHPPHSELRRAGGTTFLGKPFSPAQLRKCVAAVAGQDHRLLTDAADITDGATPDRFGPDPRSRPPR